MPSPCTRVIVILLLLAGCVVVGAADDRPEPVRQVEAAERAFARSMAERDFEAFKAFLSEEAVFLEATATFRGKQAVAERWASFFAGPEAPFSWEPEKVEVLESGTLALSTGPVYDAAGSRLGTFTSIWRLEEPGAWRVVFDTGAKFCE